MAKETEGNPWPAFVDALSTTLLVFVFLVIILILVVTALGVQVGFDIALKTLSTVQAPKHAAGKADELKTGQQATVNGKIEKEFEPDAVEVELESLVDMEINDHLIRIRYHGFNSQLDDKTKRNVEAWILKSQYDLQYKTIFVVSMLNDRALATSVAYQVAFNRISQIRKMLIDGGLLAENIKIRMDDSGSEKRNEVSIRIED